MPATPFSKESSASATFLPIAEITPVPAMSTGTIRATGAGAVDDADLAVGDADAAVGDADVAVDDVDAEVDDADAEVTVAAVMCISVS